jgi:glucokinase
LGIEIGGTKLQVVVGPGDGSTIVDRHRFTVDVGRGAEQIREHLAATIPSLVSRWHPVAIGAGYGGPVNWQTGRIVKSYHVPGWHDFPLAEWLTQVSGLPASVENDANTAALAEALQGAGAGYTRVFYVTIGSGVGGGMVCDGAIYHGNLPGETEIGHLRLDRTGTIVEDHCSGWSLNQRIRERCKDGLLAELIRADPGHEARHLGAAIRGEDPLAKQILGDAAESLGFALSHVTHLFNPEIIVLGGGVSLIGEPWRAAVAEALPRFLMDAMLPGPVVQLAGLLEDAVPHGALLIAAQPSRR